MSKIYERCLKRGGPLYLEHFTITCRGLCLNHPKNISHTYNVWLTIFNAIFTYNSKTIYTLSGVSTTSNTLTIHGCVETKKHISIKDTLIWDYIGLLMVYFIL